MRHRSAAVDDGNGGGDGGAGYCGSGGGWRDGGGGGGWRDGGGLGGRPGSPPFVRGALKMDVGCVRACYFACVCCTTVVAPPPDKFNFDI